MGRFPLRNIRFYSDVFKRYNSRLLKAGTTAIPSIAPSQYCPSLPHRGLRVTAFLQVFNPDETLLGRGREASPFPFPSLPFP